MKRIFHGVEIEHIYIDNIEPECFDYIGQDCDTQGEVWDIIKNVDTGEYYYTVL